MNAHHHTLAEVIGPLATAPVDYRHIKPAAIPEEGPAARLVQQAAERVRWLYNVGRRAVPYDDKRPEVFFDACADTYTVRLEVQEVLPDTEAAIAAAVFERAGFTSDLRPTTLPAQVEMQNTVIDAVRRIKPFFAKQAALAL